jgi:lysyl-tRNA synthetase class 2
MRSDIAWQPSAEAAVIRRRAQLYQDIRAFFAARDVLEVETPIISGAMNPDPAIASLQVQTRDAPLFMQTSPEFAMKRLLAAGLGSIWQLAKVFRAGEFGRKHNPEFTLLEWYRVGFTEQDLMAEVVALLESVSQQSLPVATVSYSAAFIQHAGFDPLQISLAELRQLTHARFAWDDPSFEVMLDLWLAEVVEPGFNPQQVTLLTQWPKAMAALAELDPNTGLARRFEVFWQGVELANGYFELIDPNQQQSRLESQQALRARTRQTVAPLDQYLQAAMDAGMPTCAGVALGVDRLLMLLCGIQDVRQVLAFPADRI